MSYKKSSRVTEADTVQAESPSLPCRQCQNVTLWDVLAKHGGMCLRCYGGYVSRPLAASPYVGEGVTQHRSWAYALRKREKDGERLTPFLAQAWRDALGQLEDAA